MPLLLVAATKMLERRVTIASHTRVPLFESKASKIREFLHTLRTTRITYGGLLGRGTSEMYSMVETVSYRNLDDQQALCTTRLPVVVPVPIVRRFV